MKYGIERDGRSPTSHPGVEKERVSSFLGSDGKVIATKLLLDSNFGASRDELTPLRRCEPTAPHRSSLRAAQLSRTAANASCKNAIMSTERAPEPEKDVAWVEAQLSAGALQDHLEAAVNKAVNEKPDNLSQRVAEHLLLASVPPVARPELFAAALLVARAGEGYEGLAETLRQLLINSTSLADAHQRVREFIASR